MLLPSGARRRSPGAGLVGGRRLCSTLAVAAAGPCIENARPSGSKGYNGRSRTRQSNPRYSAARTSISRPPRTTRSPGALPIRARALHRRGLQPTSSPCRRGLSQPATVRAAHRPTVKSGGLIDVRPEGPLQYRGLRHSAFEPPVDRRAPRTKTDIIDVEMLFRTLIASQGASLESVR
jgi:hypothetical protein